MRAIGEGSARIKERKWGHVYDYAERTTRYVLMDPDVGRILAVAASRPIAGSGRVMAVLLSRNCA